MSRLISRVRGRAVGPPLAGRLVLCWAAPWLFLTFAAQLPAARAQDLDDVTVAGTVADERGAVLPGATVTAVLAGTEAARSVVTDGAGRYRLVELRPGEYAVRVTLAGFAPGERAGVVTLAGQNVRLDFALRAAGPEVAETVVSASEVPPVDVTRVVAGGAVGREELERLASASRSALDSVFLLGGVTEGPLSTRDAAEDRDPRGGAERSAPPPEEAGLFALSGGPAYSNNVTVDGLDNNDDRAARERFLPPLDAVEEVQVVTSQFSAEYGRASGGRVNLRTRGGANEMRGRLFYYFEDESLNANSWNNNRRGLKRLPLQEHNPGFSLGGPVRLSTKYLDPLAYDGRGRTFFFVAYEHASQLDSALIDALVPVEQNPSFPLPAPTTLAGRRFEPDATPPHAPAELAPFVARVGTPSRAHALTARLDHTFNERHNATFLLQLGRSQNLRQFGGGLRLADALQGRARRTEALAVTHNFVATPRAVNQLRAQISTLRPAVRAAGARPVVLINIEDPLGGGDAADRSGTLVAGSSDAGASERRETRLQLQETLTFVRGPHTAKLGADVQRVRSSFVELTDAGGTYTFASAGDFLASAPARFRQRFHAESAQRNTYAGVFFQDEWRATPRLTLSFGLRYELESILGDRDNFGPRLGVALDPLGTGRTVLRAGAGIFYNRVLLRTLDDFTLGGSRVLFDTDALTDPATGRALTAAQRRAFIAAHLRFPETLAAGSPLVRRLGSPQTDFTRRLDPNLRIPESYQANVGFERELGRGLVVEANYTFSRGLHLWREFNANAPRLPAGYADFTAYLLSRDFPNFRDAAGARPLYDAQSAGELVRFSLAPAATADADAVARVTESGVPVSVFNLHSVGSSAALAAALAALAPLRPDPSRTQVEQLVSAGDSFYHGLTLEARGRLRAAAASLSLRAAYTLSRLTDDGVVNTSSALTPGHFRAERARSLLDRRHRLALSATLDAPPRLGSLQLAAVVRLASGAPFNLTLGADRNLDDVGNDRPLFGGDASLLRWRRPGEPLGPRLLEALRLPAVGQTGNLPRNAGRGPGLFTFDLSLAREFKLGRHMRLRPVLEMNNVLNRTVYTFGAEFVNFSALRPGATAEQRRAFLDSFLVPTRTLRPRAVRVGLKFDF